MSISQTFTGTTFVGGVIDQTNGYNSRLISITANGLSADTIVIEVGSSLAMTDAEPLKLNGSPIVLNGSTNVVTLRASGYYRVVKSAGAENVTVNVLIGL